MEESLLIAVNGLRVPWLDAIALPLGEWGLYAYPLAMIVLVIVRRRPAAPDARDGVLAFLLALFVTESVLKPLIGRPRPTAIPALLERLHVLGTVPSARSLAMPSGTAAACAAGAAWIWLKLGPRAGIPAAIFALVVSLSRIYAGIHWPSDVAVGILLGVAVAIGVDAYARWAARDW